MTGAGRSVAEVTQASGDIGKEDLTDIICKIGEMKQEGFIFQDMNYPMDSDQYLEYRLQSSFMDCGEDAEKVTPYSSPVSRSSASLSFSPSTAPPVLTPPLI